MTTRRVVHLDPEFWASEWGYEVQTETGNHIVCIADDEWDTLWVDSDE